MTSVSGEIVGTTGPDQAAIEASARIADALRIAVGLRGSASLALSGGNTPRDTYARLAKQPGVEWSKIDVFWVDERAVVPTDDRSNFRWAKATLLDAAAVPSGRVLRIEAERPDTEAAARDYEKDLRERVPADEHGVPSFDVMVLGIGEDGHTASLFPGEPTVDIQDRLVASVPAGDGREARITVTAPVIEHARRVFVLVVGRKKRAALGRVWGEHGSLRETPARVIRGCRGSVTWIADPGSLGKP